MKRIKELQQQLFSLEIEAQQLTVKKQQPLIFKFCTTDDDFVTFQDSAQRRSSVCFRSQFTPLCQSLYIGSRRSKQREGQPGQTEARTERWIVSVSQLCCSWTSWKNIVNHLWGTGTGRCIILTWTTYLYLVLGSLPLWMRADAGHNARRVPDAPKSVVKHHPASRFSLKVYPTKKVIQPLKVWLAVPHVGLLHLSPDCTEVPFQILKWQRKHRS